MKLKKHPLNNSENSQNKRKNMFGQAKENSRQLWMILRKWADVPYFKLFADSGC